MTDCARCVRLTAALRLIRDRYGYPRSPELWDIANAALNDGGDVLTDWERTEVEFERGAPVGDRHCWLSIRNKLLAIIDRLAPKP